MLCIRCELRRLMTGKSILISSVLSAVSLWVSIGSTTSLLIDMQMSGYTPQWNQIVRDAMLGTFGVMILPALSAFPYGSFALNELTSGSARYAVFRVGRKQYICSKVLACAVSGFLVQGFSYVMLCFVLECIATTMFATFISMREFFLPLPILASRMLAGSIWACVGSFAALLTQTQSAAYIMPICVSYALMLIVTNYFPYLGWLNPISWLTEITPIMPVMLIVSVALLATILGKKMWNYV